MSRRSSSSFWIYVIMLLLVVSLAINLYLVRTKQDGMTWFGNLVGKVFPIQEPRNYFYDVPTTQPTGDFPSPTPFMTPLPTQFVTSPPTSPTPFVTSTPTPFVSATPTPFVNSTPTASSVMTTTPKTSLVTSVPTLEVSNSSASTSMTFESIAEPKRMVRIDLSKARIDLNGVEGVILYTVPRADSSFSAYVYVNSRMYEFKYEHSPRIGVLIFQDEGFDTLCVYKRV